MAQDPEGAEFVRRSIETYALLQEVVREWLPAETHQRLDAVVEHWRDPLDETLVRLTPDGGSRKDWLDVLRGGTQSVRDGLTSCYYHVARIAEIENEIVEFCEKHAEHFREGDDVNFRIPSLSAEYAALQFALRRTLDYMAIAVGGFFKTEGGSFRKLDRTIDGKAPIELSDLVRARLDDTDLTGIVSNSKGHSVRDRLAHHQAVEMAWFGVHRFQGKLCIRYASEVEDIKTGDEFGESLLSTPHGGRDLSKAVGLKLRAVEEVIFGLYMDVHLLNQDSSLPFS